MGNNSAMRSIGGWFLHNFAIFVIMLAMLFHHLYWPVSAFFAGCIVLMLAFQILRSDVFSAFGIGVFCALVHFAIDRSFRFAGLIPVVSEVALFQRLLQVDALDFVGALRRGNVLAHDSPGL